MTETIQKNKANQFDYILQMFTCEDSIREEFKHIHNDGEHCYAVRHAHVLMRVSKELCGLKHEAVRNYPNAKSIFDNNSIVFNENLFTITIADLLSILADKKPQWEVQKKNCEKCKGNGYTTCNCCGSEVDCKDCDATGESDENLPYAYAEMSGEDIKLNKRIYSPTYLNMVSMAFLAIGADTIIVHNDTVETKPIMFRPAFFRNEEAYDTFSSNVEIMVMPKYKGDEEND